jgi:type IV pilus assembly protein PilE
VTNNLTAKFHQGYTLVELMVVLAIITVLAGATFAAGGHNLSKTARANAKAKLLDIRAKEEQYFIDNKNYTSNLLDLRLVVASGDSLFINDKGVAADSSSAAYEITLLPKDGYTVIANARNRQESNEDEACTVISINASGSKSPAHCW